MTSGSKGTSRVVHNTGNTEWNTPREIVERVAYALGGVIDLDPCTNPEAQTIVQARRWLTSREYALSPDTDWLPRGGAGHGLPEPAVRDEADQAVRGAAAEGDQPRGDRGGGLAVEFEHGNAGRPDAPRGGAGGAVPGGADQVPGARLETEDDAGAGADDRGLGARPRHTAVRGGFQGDGHNSDPRKG